MRQAIDRPARLASRNWALILRSGDATAYVASSWFAAPAGGASTAATGRRARQPTQASAISHEVTSLSAPGLRRARRFGRATASPWRARPLRWLGVPIAVHDSSCPHHGHAAGLGPAQLAVGSAGEQDHRDAKPLSLLERAVGRRVQLERHAAIPADRDGEAAPGQ